MVGSDSCCQCHPSSANPSEAGSTCSCPAASLPVPVRPNYGALPDIKHQTHSVSSGQDTIVYLNGLSESERSLLWHNHEANHPENDPTSALRKIDSDQERGVVYRKASGLWNGYLNALEQHALLTKVITSTVISGLSDLLAQLIEAWATGQTLSLMAIDWRRVWALAVVGGILTAPMFHYVYEGMEISIPVSKTPINTILQLAIDQLVACPIWLLLFFPLISVVEGTFNIPDVVGQIRRDFLTSMKLLWIFSAPIQLLSFTLLPRSFRVLVLNMFDLGFTGVLSYMKHIPHNPTGIAT